MVNERYFRFYVADGNLPERDCIISATVGALIEL